MDHENELKKVIKHWPTHTMIIRAAISTMYETHTHNNWASNVPCCDACSTHGPGGATSLSRWRVGPDLGKTGNLGAIPVSDFGPPPVRHIDWGPGGA